MSRIIDLTLPLTPGMRGVAMEPKFTYERDGWNAEGFPGQVAKSVRGEVTRTGGLQKCWPA